MSQKSFGFMTAPVYGQWICHSPKPMKTDIFFFKEGRQECNPTERSIRFDSPARQVAYGTELAEIRCNGSTSNLMKPSFLAICLMALLLFGGPRDVRAQVYGGYQYVSYEEIQY
jgi:hypothetical protein